MVSYNKKTDYEHIKYYRHEKKINNTQHLRAILNRLPISGSDRDKHSL